MKAEELVNALLDKVANVKFFDDYDDQIKGFHYPFGNHTLSVQFGPCNYCDSYYAEEGARWTDSTTAEIAIWDDQGRWCYFDNGDTVNGWVPIAQIAEIINRLEGEKK